MEFNKTMIRLFAFLLFPIYLLHQMLLSKSIREKLTGDFIRWCQWKELNASAINFCYLFLKYKEFRSICYNRMKWRRLFLPYLFHGQTNLTIACDNIGPGLIIQHGYSTVICAESIGKNCHINQCVNIVWNGDRQCKIGDSVNIFAGAIIIGGVEIGDNATIGAGAVVNKDVPPDTLVVGNPMRIIYR